MIPNNLREYAGLDKEVVVTMTFTSPTCPMMEELMLQVKDAVQSVCGETSVRIELVWDPPWDLSKMSDAARVELDLYSVTTVLSVV